jgi:hypothetical protein
MITTEQQLVIDKFGRYCHEKGASTDMLLKIIELAITYGNIRTVSDYAKQNNLSYQGVVKTRNIVEILGVKCVVENNN